MNSHNAAVYACVLSWMLAFPPVSPRASSPDGASGIVELLEADSRIGEWVFYHQRFLDSDNQWAEYQGSVYAAVKEVKLDECRIEMKTAIIDKFTGIVGKIGTGEQQDSTYYELSFTLSRPIAQTMEVVEARPSQLRRTTHSECDERPSCELTWVRFKSPQHRISERVSMNDQTEFNGATTTAVFPVSSTAIGSKAIKELQLLANSKCP
jgi:hypothetical protein